MESTTSNLKKLPRNWSEFLLSKPETGMDYQIIAVTLKDGRKIEDIAIIGHSIIGEVRGCDDVPFDPNEISSIEVTHNKWKFKR
ncbi:MAG TPA: hypothetical protein VHG89_13125 [Verrucomicrobiae bacterium]|nr:hypothetical protein [Verrucomicrobiae bacterium]